MPLRVILQAQNCNHLKLHKELVEAGIRYPMVTAYPDGRFEIEVDSDETEIAQQVIANHDPTPEPPEATVEEKLQDIEAAIAYIVGHL